MTNMMFMPPGGLVVEMIGEFKDVNMPLCGYYNTMASINGLHYLLYTYNFFDSKGEKAIFKMDPEMAASEAFRFYGYIRNLTNYQPDEAVHNATVKIH